MATASERIVVQTTQQEKRALLLKAKRLGLPLAELMRRGAGSYRPESSDEQLGALADAAKAAAQSMSKDIQEALQFIEQSNRRIAALDSASHCKG